MFMQTVLVLILSMLLAFKSSSQTFTINGEIKNIESGNVFLELNNTAIDSTLLIKGKFTFKGQIDIPRYASISIGERRVFFVLENTGIFINGSIDSLWNSTVIGSPLTTSSNDYENKYVSPVGKKLRANTKLANELLAKNDSIGASKLLNENGALVNKSRGLTREYVSNNDSYLGLFLLNNVKDEFYTNEIDSLLKNNYKHFSDNALYKNVSKYIENERSIGVGNLLKDFSIKDTLGIIYNTINFRGKYILIDFWSSWCGICRKETPLLKRLYQTYHSKNFEIIAVSIDTDKSKWINAMRKDLPTWINGLDEKRIGGIAELLNIYSVPSNFLIDPKGVIIGRDLHNEALEEALLKYLGK
jgi:thiol-disulfide isomerase/thioredoxin